ncbi:MAG: ABC transporter ATP-binding protein [Chloroflexi bacterium]|nr:ABC transporter ATP-binding protein [Chloroflexota bacterium]
MASPIIEVSKLTKDFGARRALRGVDLTLQEGEFLVLFGPNGSGKSTLIRILATLVKPTSGSVRIAGREVKDDPRAVRPLIGMVGHQTFLYDDLTVRENLDFYGKMYQTPQLPETMGSLAEMLGLTPWLDERVRTLSRGWQQRTSLARALVHDPPILLLDEPETGLDPEAISQLPQWLNRADHPSPSSPSRRTVLMTSHNLDRAGDTGDSVAVLAYGRMQYRAPRAGLDLPSFKETYHRLTQGAMGGRA